MRPRQTVPGPLLRLAQHQDGVVTTAQATGLGLTRHMIARLTGDGSWQRLGTGALFTASGPVSWPAVAWAGVLLGGPEARLGPRASAFVVGIVSDQPQPVDVLVPMSRRLRPHSRWEFHREWPGVRSRRSVGSPPRLTVEDTLLDLAEVESSGEVVTLVSTAMRRRLTVPRRLAARLAERDRHSQRRLLTDLLADVEIGVESGLERRYLHDVERAHGLPKPDRQRRRVDLGYRSDVIYDDYGVLIELDGRRGHEDTPFRDLARDNTFALESRVTLRYGWWDVTERPCVVARQVADLLVRRGWRGLPGRCRNCRAVPDEHSLLRSAG